MIKLKDEPKDSISEFIPGFGRQIVDPLPLQHDLTYIRFVQKSNQVQQCALAGTALAYNRDKLATMGGEFDSAKHVDSVMAFDVRLLDSNCVDQVMWHADGFRHF